jgi:hypothetical protein
LNNFVNNKAYYASKILTIVLIVKKKYINLLQAHAIGIKRRKERVESGNHQDCIADIDFHIWNLRISASLPWFRPFIRQ